jgi:hypothetical protein
LSESRILSTISGPNRQEIEPDKKMMKTALEELHNFRVAKSRRIRWAEHVVHVGEI